MDKSPLYLFLGCFCWIFLSTPIKSQHDSFNPDLHYPDLIVVKFVDDLDIQFLPAKNTVENAADNSSEIIAFFDQFEWLWPYQVEREKLSETIRNIPVRRSNTAYIPNIANRFNLRIQSDISMDDAIVQLRSMVGIEYAYPVPLPVTPALAPDFEANQGYLNESPTGIDTRFMWDSMNISGHGMKIVDIEYNFNPNHLDLPEVGILGGIPYDFFGDNHGTAVLGQLGGLDNGWGVTGMVPDADYFFHYSFIEQNFLDIGSAVVNSAFLIEEGDVILIEAQTSGPLYDPSAGNQFGLVPVEWFRPWYEDIVVAVAMGRVVIAAGGNGAQDLDDSIYQQSSHMPFLPINNSGSIIVGAGAAPSEFNGTSAARSRLTFSNYGSRVNLQGWGQRIYTTGYGSAYDAGGKDLYFASSFGGTSGASPIVTAAAALLQQAHKNFKGTFLTGPEILEILETTGVPQQSGGNPSSQNIGPLPDLKAALAYAGIPNCNDLLAISFVVDTLKCSSVSGASIRPDSIYGDQHSFSYSWNTGDTTLALENISSGFYELAVTNSLGCKKVYSFDLPALDSIEITTEILESGCYGQQNGRLSIQIQSRLTDSVYLFLDDQLVGSQLDQLSSGIYQVVATAGSNCSTTVVVEIPDGDWVDFSLEGNLITQVEESSFFFADIDSFEIYKWSAEHADIIAGQGTAHIEIKWNQPGVYRLGLTAGTENCLQSRWLKILVEEPVATSGIPDLTSINIYPNPASDILNIVVEDFSPHDLEVQIFSMDGKLLYSGLHTSPHIQIDLSVFPASLLNLIIKKEDQIVIDQKVIVQK